MLHVAIIMDGNGRWATARGLPRTAGHLAGVRALRAIVEAAPAMGVGTLSAFAFSTENWRRPRSEVGALMGMMGGYLRDELDKLIESGVRLSVLGRRDRLPRGLAERIAHAERATASGRALDLRLAVDYSARDAIVAAIASLGPAATREAISARLAAHGGGPPVDLLIRTSGELRLSDFMLWEAAFAELYFTDELWPDFDVSSLAEALQAYRRRERRYGGIAKGAEGPATVEPAAAYG